MAIKANIIENTKEDIELLKELARKFLYPNE